MKTKLSLTIILLAFLFLPAVTLAASKTPEKRAKEHGVTFPVAELGNCGSVQDCKNFCSSQANFETCKTYAKSKGFYKSGILGDAKRLLGCDSVDSCRVFCEQKVNREKCNTLAQKHGFATPPSPSTAPKTDDEIQELAKAELGCNSQETCLELCAQEANFDRCSTFALRHGLEGGMQDLTKIMEVAKRVLGCTSPVSCMKFCSDPANADKCQQFAKEAGFETGPSPSQEPPEIWCPKAGNVGDVCSWDGANCVCWNPEQCSQNSGCSWTGTTCQCQAFEESPEVWCPKAGPNCSWNGESCNCFDPGECTQFPGCSWTGTSCECTSESISSTNEPGEVWCPKASTETQVCTWDGGSCTCWNPDECTKYAGCTWTGIKCDCQPAEGSPPVDEPPEVWCPRNPGCSWTGETCQCTPVQQGEPAVQGAKVSQNPLQIILDTLRNLLPL